MGGGDQEWNALLGRFGSLPGARQVIVVELDRIQTSCGFGVPRMTFAGERSELIQWAQARGEAGLREYRARNNSASIDGIKAPG